MPCTYAILCFICLASRPILEILKQEQLGIGRALFTKPWGPAAAGYICPIILSHGSDTDPWFTKY